MTATITDLFDFEIHSGVIQNVEFLNKILGNLNPPPITENPDFTLDKDSSGTNVINIKVKSLRNRNSIEMWLEVGSDHIRLDLDGIAETFEWANFKDSKEEVADFIRHIFTGHILIESGVGSRFIQIFDADGSLFHSLSYNGWLQMLTGLHVWRRGTHRRLFTPFL